MRKLIATALVSGLAFSVYVATGSVQEQADALADAGIYPPTRDATCPVRLDPDYAADAGLSVYQRLTFPVVVRVLPDGGRDVQLPPMPAQRVRQALDVIDWSDCDLAAASPPVSARWGSARSFAAVPKALNPWCRAKLPALPCLRKQLDGGVASFGDRNVYSCAQAAIPATCERVSSGTVFLGDSDEDL